MKVAAVWRKDGQIITNAEITINGMHIMLFEIGVGLIAQGNIQFTQTPFDGADHHLRLMVLVHVENTEYRKETWFIKF